MGDLFCFGLARSVGRLAVALGHSKTAIKYTFVPMRLLRFLLALFLSWVWAQGEDTLRSYVLDTVAITEVRSLSSFSGESGAEKLMRLFSGVQLAYRAVPFAQEVVYQGLLPQQTQITIDGMRVLPACVDRMDPVLTFVEAAAMESATWQSQWGATPTLSVGLPSPEGESGGRATLLVGNPYHRLFANLFHRQNLGKFSAVSALTFRLGGPYRTGRAFTPGVSYGQSLSWSKDTTLEIPAFRKLNVYTALQYALSETHALELSYLGDYFYDVAYPALIMDARHSAMHLVSVRHRWRGVSDLRVYGSTVFHDMTDEDRSEEEIRTRIVMPGMYMPMRGRTQSLGGTWTVTWIERQRFQLRQRSEFGWHRAWASMDMQLLSGGAPMRLLNLADVDFVQDGSTIQATFLYQGWQVEAEGGFTHFAYEAKDTLGFLPLALYQERYAEGAAQERNFLVYQVGGLLRRTWAAHQLTLSLRYGTRAPSHTELYAYYLYVPMDNSLLMGNSLLRPERLLRGELTYRSTSGPLAWAVSVYGNRMEEYIAPVTFLPSGAPGNGIRQQWRMLQNIGRAYTLGATAQGSWHITENLLAELTSGYTYGWQETLREPLPWIYPFFSRLRLTQAWERHRLSAELYGAAAQAHLSRTIYLEDYTPAYALLHLRYGYQLLLPREGRSWGLTLTASVENLLNTYGWDHLSVGNMPFLGRVLRAGAVAQWGK